MKYRPTYPRRPFENLLAARQWVDTFVQWYNHEHRHSAIGFVTPDERHAGKDSALLSQRVEVYEAAKARYPERWSGPSSLSDLPDRNNVSDRNDPMMDLSNIYCVSKVSNR